MHDFGQICYLDPPKTGTTFVSAFLRKHLALDEVSFRKHLRVKAPQHMQPLGKLFFITSRDPMRQYQSLYSFGCSIPDTPLRQSLEKAGLETESLYDGTADGFAAWVALLLDPSHAPDLEFGFTPDLAGLIGLQSFRYLSLSFFEPLKRLRDVQSEADLRALYTAHHLPRFVLRTEHLAPDLAALVRAALWPYLRDPDRALAELEQDAQRLNVSPRMDKTGGFALPDTLEERLRMAEWFLYEIRDAPTRFGHTTLF